MSNGTDYGINNVQTRQIEVVGPGGQPASMYRVQFYVNDQGPFVRYYTPAQYDSDQPQQDMEAEAKRLNRFGLFLQRPTPITAAFSPASVATHAFSGQQTRAGDRIQGQTYSSSIEGFADDPQGADQLPSLAKCWANVRVLSVPTSLDSSTPDGQQQIQNQFGIQPQGPRRYFVVVRFQGQWIGGPDCVV